MKRVDDEIDETLYERFDMSRKEQRIHLLWIDGNGQIQHPFRWFVHLERMGKSELK